MGLKLICHCIWVLKSHAIWFIERGIIYSQRPGDFLLASVFCWNWKKNSLTSHSQIATTTAYQPPQVNQELPVGPITKRRKKEKRDKTKIRVGTSVTVKIGDIDKKIKGGRIRRARKDLVGCLAYIYSVLVLYQLWRLVHVFSLQMVNFRKGLIRNSHTCIETNFPLIHLSTL